MLGRWGPAAKGWWNILTPWHPSKFVALETHPLTRIAREQLPGLDVVVYHCLITNYFGLGYFLDVSPDKIWPGAIRGVRVFKELVSLGQDLNKVTREQIVELRQRMQFNAKDAREAVRGFEKKRLMELQEFEDEQQNVRSWLTQTTGHDAPTSMWNRRTVRFSFGGRGETKSKRLALSPSFGSL